MSIKIFYDLLSQPARSVLMFARANKIPYTPCPLITSKLEHRTDEYAAINPFKKVPAIQDGDFNLTESITITKYLHEKFDCPDHWYPRNLEQRARVNEYLDWQHTYARPKFMEVVLQDALYPAMTGKQPDRTALEPDVKKMVKTLGEVESYFLRDKPFLCGDDISIADLFGANEALMLDLTSYNPLEKRPNVKAWIERVRQRVDPEIFDDVCKVVNMILNAKTKPKD